MLKNCVYIINKQGTIVQRINNNFQFDNREINNLKALVEPSNLDKFYNFIKELNNDRDVMNFEMNLKINDTIDTYFINALKINPEEIIVILTKALIQDDSIISHIIEMNNMQTNQLRELNKKIAENERIDLDNENFNEITKLNNKLSNTQRKLTKKNLELEITSKRLEAVIENINQHIVLADAGGKVLLSNSRFKEEFNYQENIFEFFKNSNNEFYQKIKNRFNATDKDLIYLEDFKLKQDSEKFYDINISIIKNKEGETNFYVFSFEDVTKRKENLRKLKNLKTAFDQSHENIIITNTNDKIIFVNKAFCDEYGYSKDELMNEAIDHYIQEVHQASDNVIFDEEITFNQRKDGTLFPVDISQTNVKENGDIISKVYFIDNISQKIAYEEKLKTLATKDKMTNAYSREAGILYLKNKIEEFSHNNKDIAIIFIDINGLKKVNDHYGHNAGDALIKKVSSIINNVIREDDALTRLGGDEFLIILPRSTKANAEKIRQRIYKKIATVNTTNDCDFKISISSGIAEYSEDKFDKVDDFINLADDRMYQEKEQYYKKLQEENHNE